MRRFVEQLDVSFSYTDAVAADVLLIKSHLGGSVTLYDYRDWLDEQAGAQIADLAGSIYVNLPCIILAARDWFFRPATLLEQRLLAINTQPKLVFDYADEFLRREELLGIARVTYGRFGEEDTPDLQQVSDFVLSCFSTQ